MAKKWDKCSRAFGLFYGCLGAIDGWLCTIERPSDVEDPSDFFSGHYQKHGLNVQAICDAYLCITYIAVAANGGTNDIRAFKRLKELRRWIDTLPIGFFCIGDNAYKLMNKFLIPFSGSNKHIVENDTYNFYLSQIRI